MNVFSLLGYACWIGSAILLLWLVVDFMRTNSQFEEDFLLSSREGHDEIAEQEKMFAADREKVKNA
ncbi:MAG: hypothetical protein JRK53_01275 [Deltaproteobacteria bacterium]|nr:hypothetical protein [Deltaproteobacteria bacterium]MBW1819470.1 hypothetical protein [Deltaproteobacteria bacterium]